MTSLELAMKFHEVYERLAPQFGYETRKETRAFATETPNGRLMIAVCAELLSEVTEPALLAEVARLQGERDAAKSKLGEVLNSELDELKSVRAQIVQALDAKVKLTVERDTLTAELTALRERLERVTVAWDKMNRTRVPTPTEYLLEPDNPMLVDMKAYREFDDVIRPSLTAPANESGVGK